MRSWRSRRHVPLLLLGLAAVAAGAPRGVLAAPADPSCPAALGEYLGSVHESLGGGLAATVASLGEPRSVEARVVPNLHDPGYQDVEWHLGYGDGAAIVVRETGTGRELLVSAAFSPAFARSHRIPLPGGSPQDVGTRFGAAPAAADGSLSATCPNEVGADAVRLTVAGGRVSAVRVEYFLD